MILLLTFYYLNTTRVLEHIGTSYFHTCFMPYQVFSSVAGDKVFLLIVELSDPSLLWIFLLFFLFFLFVNIF